MHLHPFISTLCSCNQNKIKFKGKKKKGKKEKPVFSQKLKHDTVSHLVNPFIHIYIYAQVFIAKTHWSGLRPPVSATLLLLGPHWDSLLILMVRCVVEILQLWSPGMAPSCAPADHKRGGCWGGPTQPCFWTCIVAGLVSRQLSLVLTTRVSSPALSWPVVPWQQ